MERKFKQVEGHPDLVRDTKTHAIINRNTNAYEKAKRRAASAQAQRDEIRETTREINNIKCEMHEIKSLLIKISEK